MSESGGDTRAQRGAGSTKSTRMHLYRRTWDLSRAVLRLVGVGISGRDERAQRGVCGVSGNVEHGEGAGLRGQYRRVRVHTLPGVRVQAVDASAMTLSMEKVAVLTAEAVQADTAEYGEGAGLREEKTGRPV